MGIDTLLAVCGALDAGQHGQAGDLIRDGYPFKPRMPSKRRYTKLEMMRVFMRDGFVDRYFGDRLVFPGTLYLLSLLMPSVFPYHPHGKTSVSHFAYWELWPSIDHVVPVTRGGLDELSNWVTASMQRNQAKSHSMLEEIGWSLKPPGDVATWDGLTSWYLAYVDANPILPEGPMLRIMRQWEEAARSL